MLIYGYRKRVLQRSHQDGGDRQTRRHIPHLDHSRDVWRHGHQPGRTVRQPERPGTARQVRPRRVRIRHERDIQHLVACGVSRSGGRLRRGPALREETDLHAQRRIRDAGHGQIPGLPQDQDVHRGSGRAQEARGTRRRGQLHQQLGTSHLRGTPCRCRAGDDRDGDGTRQRQEAHQVHLRLQLPGVQARTGERTGRGTGLPVDGRTHRHRRHDLPGDVRGVRPALREGGTQGHPQHRTHLHASHLR